MRKMLMIVPAALALMGAKGHDSDTSGAPALVTLEAIRVPIVDGGRFEGTLEAKVALRSSDADLLSEQLPVVRAATRGALAEYARLHVSPWQAVDSAALASALDLANRKAVPAVEGALLLEVRARAS